MKIKYFVFFNLERKRPLKDCNFTRMSAVAKKKLQRNARGREQCYLNNSYFFFPYFFFFFLTRVCSSHQLLPIACLPRVVQ